MRLLIASLVFLFAADAHVLAEDEDMWRPPPDHLIIGYEGEGKIDTSDKACEAFVRGIVEWSEDAIAIGTAEVCGARKRHRQAYEALQKSYATLREHLLGRHKLESAEAIKSFEGMVKGCIDHKTGLSDGGHNIRSDIIPNDNAATCLKIGKELLDAEIDWFKIGFTESHPAP